MRPLLFLMEWVSLSIINFRSFSETALGFVLNFEIVYQAFALALIMGLHGGFLPALQAARYNIIETLRMS